MSHGRRSVAFAGTIEDAAKLRLAKPHVISLEAPLWPTDRLLLALEDEQLAGLVSRPVAE